MTAGGLCLLAAVLCLSVPARAREADGSALESLGQETAQI
jgi:hypothetical protein